MGNYNVSVMLFLLVLILARGMYDIQNKMILFFLFDFNLCHVVYFICPFVLFLLAILLSVLLQFTVSSNFSQLNDTNNNVPFFEFENKMVKCLIIETSYIIDNFV